MAEHTLAVTLCWSLAPRHIQEMSLRVPVGSTVASVLAQGVAQWRQSKAVADESLDGLSDAAQSSSLEFQQPGIWSRKVPWTQPVQDGDRIELYRPLKVDPKVARRQRFKRQGKGRTGLFANRKSGSAAGY
ncbi:RnfH family protein [Limnohabitans sp. Rim47]|jgi:putative ubiquitin-RnfH superfamily antitoxin RatB of RatAB toxin-antitoxin module|uniref:RnfH family protein n=1 Tax=Limnohabitans sp. Rim47 TaxID=1100721 RepID=UPI000303E5F5|nr:RnfH family protein [Limnohabitans sp. Rim47]